MLCEGIIYGQSYAVGADLKTLNGLPNLEYNVEEEDNVRERDENEGERMGEGELGLAVERSVLVVPCQSL